MQKINFYKNDNTEQKCEVLSIVLRKFLQTS